MSLPPEENLLPCPYALGSKFLLQVSPPIGSAYKALVTVQYAYTPFTVSPVMRVSLDFIVPVPDDPDQHFPRPPPEMVLRVYDRRFSLLLRERHLVKPPTLRSEALYRQLIASGQAPEADDISGAITSHGSIKNCPVGLMEHLMTLMVEPYFEDECAAYERLISLQGQDIPIFYGAPKFLDGLSIDDLDPPVPGILLEVVPGIPLDTINPTRTNVDAVIRSAIRIIDRYSELGVLNEDVRLGNFILKPNDSVVMIDFAQSRLREDHETEEEWRNDKHMADEEGGISFQAKKKYNWQYVCTLKFYDPPKVPGK
ncbi:hypothetical protein RhiJN_11570 [Ceratobasidium sp. AG-Ba]|nr:hypothetical protein RhiJN_11570 [Ceratobasidium sp. AG-Ba]QRW06008.1 hypothetical protein RhiLY_05007 [Ceratobasidium sp. AG-Ba]QRW12265.1 hypothetical protein RhiLY_11264 [Ceratobasidium sp. AG-Ba]